MSWGDTYNRHKAKGMDPNDAALRADQAESRKAKPENEGHPVAAVIAFYPGEREPRLLSWNHMPDGEHKLYAAPSPVSNVGAAIVPPHCSGSAFSFDPGVLHVSKDGSGYIAVNEDDFVLEDDRDGEGGSIHWIVRLDASEIAALRDFLNGAPRAHASEAIFDVLAERRRQVDVEGWSPAHDDAHVDFSLARAATIYAAGATLNGPDRAVMDEFGASGTPGWMKELWPWHIGWWKPSSRRRDLVKAAALVIAEIERLDRATLPTEGR